ncbi:MAG: hypothetical protein ACFFEK_10155 [Candidatus Thorarchaeota archaeon]
MHYRNRDYWPTPTEDVIRNYRDRPYYPLPQYIGPSENPGAFGFLRA